MITTNHLPSHEPYNQVLEITPAKATYWLDANEGNRRLDWNYIAQLARDIKAGQFACTHQGIAFDTQGRLIERSTSTLGHHRGRCPRQDTSVLQRITRGRDSHRRQSPSPRRRPHDARGAALARSVPRSWPHSVRCSAGLRCPRSDGPFTRRCLYWKGTERQSISRMSTFRLPGRRDWPTACPVLWWQGHCIASATKGSWPILRCAAAWCFDRFIGTHCRDVVRYVPDRVAQVRHEPNRPPAAICTCDAGALHAYLQCEPLKILPWKHGGVLFTRRNSVGCRGVVWRFQTPREKGFPQ